MLSCKGLSHVPTGHHPAITEPFRSAQLSLRGTGAGGGSQPAAACIGSNGLSYARLILDLQQRGAAGVVVGAPEGGDVFLLECR